MGVLPLTSDRLRAIASPFNKEVTAMSKTHFPRLLGLAAGLGLMLGSAGAFAQEAATPPAVATETPGLSMGVATGPLTQEQAAVGDTYLAKNFELWEQRCVKTADGADPCQLYQLLKDGENSVAEISMFGLPEGGQAAAGATVIVPLQTLLTANLTIAIDGTQPKIYPFTFCAEIGCIARIGFTGEEITQFKKGAKAVMTIVPAAAPDQKVNVEISLKGFTAGFDSVNATTPKPAN